MPGPGPRLRNVHRGLRLLVLLASGVLLGGGCGDETPQTMAEYRSALNSACQEQYEAFTSLPQKQQDEGLETDELDELAREASERFVGKVESLRPPTELERAHQTLLDALHEKPPRQGDLEALRARTAGFTGTYADLGARRCAALQRRAVEGLEQARANPAG